MTAITCGISAATPRHGSGGDQQRRRIQHGRRREHRRSTRPAHVAHPAEHDQQRGRHGEVDVDHRQDLSSDGGMLGIATLIGCQIQQRHEEPEC
ncbi:hypothetical protein [Amycolatopsis jejuensis]|uniref:hypothetical protein n=1 Tax=Amycolatopsis jejuensis TaxID=330084 RepID=UPI0012E0ADEC|nr:hypothetical protein [Amycolatopsis jejuensis]